MHQAFMGLKGVELFGFMNNKPPVKTLTHGSLSWELYLYCSSFNVCCLLILFSIGKMFLLPVGDMLCFVGGLVRDLVIAISNGLL